MSRRHGTRDASREKTGESIRATTRSLTGWLTVNLGRLNMFRHGGVFPGEKKRRSTGDGAAPVPGFARSYARDEPQHGMTSQRAVRIRRRECGVACVLESQSLAWPSTAGRDKFRCACNIRFRSLTTYYLKNTELKPHQHAESQPLLGEKRQESLSRGQD